MTIEENIEKILHDLEGDSLLIHSTDGNPAKVIRFDEVKKRLIELQLDISLKKITDKSVAITFTVPLNLPQLKGDIAAYIHDYIIQRISYRSMKDDRLRYWELKDKIEKAIKQS